MSRSFESPKRLSAADLGGRPLLLCMSPHFCPDVLEIGLKQWSETVSDNDDLSLNDWNCAKLEAIHQAMSPTGGGSITAQVQKSIEVSFGMNASCTIARAFGYRLLTIV